MGTRVLKLSLIIGISILVLIGCNNKGVNQFSPEQVINNSLVESDEVNRYYAEYEIIIEVKDEQPEKMTLKEWRDGSKARVEVSSDHEQAITVFDGKQFIAYDITNNQVFMAEDAEELDFNQTSLKEQAEHLLTMIGESHDTEIIGEAEVAGRDTFHLIANQKDDTSLLGDQELWIDKENWMVLKIITTSGDTTATSEYKKVDFMADISDDLFMLDLPDDVVIHDFDDFGYDDVANLEDALEIFGESFLYIVENDTLKLESIGYSELQELNQKELNLIYEQDGLPYLELSVVALEMDGEEDLDLSDLGEKITDVRGQTGTYLKVEDFRMISWEEDGLNYSVQLVDPNLNTDEIKDVLEKMEMKK